MAQGYDPAKAAVFNQLIQDGLSEDAALKQAGILGSDIGNYELGDNGQLGPIVIGFGKTPGVNNVTNNAAAQAFVASFNDAGPVNFNDTGPANFNDTGTISASSIKTITTTTTTTSGGGSTLRIADVGTTTPASAAYQAQANVTYNDIKSISRALGPAQFGGNPNLTQEERNALIAQRSALYQQYNQDTTASTNALAPSAPVGSVTTPNTTTTTQTTQYATASTNAPISGATDTQLQEQEIASTSTPPSDADISRNTPVDPTTNGAVVQQPDDTFMAAEDLPVDPATDPTTSGEFVQQSDGTFVIAEDLPVDPATDPTVGGAFVQQPDGSFVAAEDLAPVDINGEAYSPTEDPNTPQEVSAVTTDAFARSPGSYTAAELDAIAAAQGVDAGDGTDTGITEKFLYNNEEAAQTAGFANQARQQQTIAAQRKQVNNQDWRVKLRLAPQSKYLYNAPSPGILAPLTITDGVVFPYTPTINTAYRANYSSYDLTHSNFRGYFYQNSYVDAVNINATFTAQDTAEANYLLAVIHFFRSATKMFYGQDAERGSPPPLTYLTGLGEYQFNEHPCLIQSFTYNLPAEVDYIRAGSVSNSGTNLTTDRNRQSVATQGVFGSLNRLAAAFLTKGAIPGVRAPGLLQINNPTYVPTKMEIQLTLLPIQSRQQVSKQFSVKNFANGNLLRGGFW